jgi:hypothetical protein
MRLTRQTSSDRPLRDVILERGVETSFARLGHNRPRSPPSGSSRRDCSSPRSPGHRDSGKLNLGRPVSAVGPRTPSPPRARPIRSPRRPSRTGSAGSAATRTRMQPEPPPVRSEPPQPVAQASRHGQDRLTMPTDLASQGTCHVRTPPASPRSARSPCRSHRLRYVRIFPASPQSTGEKRELRARRGQPGTLAFTAGIVRANTPAALLSRHPLRSVAFPSEHPTTVSA